MLYIIFYYLILNISTTIRANIFGQINDQEGIPVNLKMTTISTGRRIHSHGEKEKIFPPSQQNNFDKNEIIGKIQKRIKNIKKEEEDEDFNTHELCCFWAVAGECNNNPFWMRVKCPMTCGTCGCKVKRADKCKSTGVKCILTTTTTISTSTEQTTKTTLTTTTTKGPTPPPLTTTPTTTISTKKRKTRPTPPPKMPGHRPQRPKQWKSSTPKETSKHPKIVSLKKEYPFNPSFISKNNFVNGDGVSDLNNLNNDYYSDETEEPQLIEEENIYSTTIKFKQIYEEYLKKNNKLNKENKKIINKNWLNNLKTTPIEPLTLPTDKTITTTTTIITTTTTTKRQTCFNYHKLCEFWADMGECESNPFWMRPHCQKSCSSCGESLGDISTPKPKSGCSNIHILCPFWAFIGECGRNPRWMGMHCRATLNLMFMLDKYFLEVPDKQTDRNRSTLFHRRRFPHLRLNPLIKYLITEIVFGCIRLESIETDTLISKNYFLINLKSTSNYIFIIIE
ncbi:ShKT domain-containing protein [Meloidogyne graminicola]|uniref:ShKT domain-containing protein n=1 Tax=Meloidogyne graminicola TaxID=189291 RepID=A0A8S9ZR58_9BILA|nr:ShKT domain-containing protein [Meloidogyne graminicola]